jgi:ABC-type enterochelin transport system permease subunit
VDHKTVTVQKAVSASLCLVATVAGAYTALQGSWLFTGLLLAGLAAAVRSYQVVETPDPVVDDI